MNFAQKLRILREGKGLSQRKLADELDVSFRAYQGYESGKTYPRSQLVYQRIANYFSVTVDSLLSDADSFIISLSAKYGNKAAMQAQQILDETGALFAGGELTDEDEEAFRKHMMKILTKTIEPDGCEYGK
ncbi:MAG: helix-turn-helix transcriptional regulator [Clostridia bacterium]